MQNEKWKYRMHTMGFKMWITRKVHSMHMRQISFENRVRAFLVWIPICICTYVRICVLCVSNKSYFFSKLAKICIKKCVISIMKAYEIQFEYSVCRWIPREIVQHVWISFAYSVTLYAQPTPTCVLNPLFALDQQLNASFSEHNFISSTLARFCIRYFRWHSAQSNPVRSISAMLLFYAQHSDDRRQNHINEFYGNFIIFRR